MPGKGQPEVTRRPASKSQGPLQRQLAITGARLDIGLEPGAAMRIAFDNSFHATMEGFYAPAEAAQPSAPRLLAFNHALGERLGLDIEAADDGELARHFSGAELPPGADPLALAYAGHQFGHFSPQLGDGRALLLGEIVAPDGARFDIQLKGSGPTPFSRNGDGKAAIGPVLREYLVSGARGARGGPATGAVRAT